MDKVSRALTLLASVAAIAPGPANAQPIVFAKGDSSFSALIYKDSRFAKGDMLVESVQNGLWLDSATIYQLDLSAVPGVQLDSARTLARRLIEESNVGAVIMFVVDQEFDLKRFCH